MGLQGLPEGNQPQVTGDAVTSQREQTEQITRGQKLKQGFKNFLIAVTSPFTNPMGVARALLKCRSSAPPQGGIAAFAALQTSLDSYKAKEGKPMPQADLEALLPKDPDPDTLQQLVTLATADEIEKDEYADTGTVQQTGTLPKGHKVGRGNPSICRAALNKLLTSNLPAGYEKTVAVAARTKTDSEFVDLIVSDFMPDAASLDRAKQAVMQTGLSEEAATAFVLTSHALNLSNIATATIRDPNTTTEERKSVISRAQTLQTAFAPGKPMPKTDLFYQKDIDSQQAKEAAWQRVQDWKAQLGK